MGKHRVRQEWSCWTYLKADLDPKWANPQEGGHPQGHSTDKCHKNLLLAHMKKQIPKCIIYFWFGEVEKKK